MKRESAGRFAFAAIALAFLFPWRPAVPDAGDRPGGPQPPGIRLDRIDEAEPGAALPPGWEIRPVRGYEPPRTVVVEEDGERVLRIISEGEAAFFWCVLKEPLAAEEGTLAWSWRVSDGLEQTDLFDEERNDSAARLIVTFGRPGLLRRPRVIFYSWAGRERIGMRFRAAANAGMGVMVVANDGDPLDVWSTVRVEPAADYQAIFGREAPPISAVGIMVDTDQTGQRAETYLREIRWLPGG